MNMHRKEYYLVAETLAKGKSSPDLEYFADLLAVAFAKENPTFNRELFMKVCGVEETK